MAGPRAPVRRVLLFAYYFPPLGGPGSIRALSFATHLPALGWEVTVLTPRSGVFGVDPTLVAEGMAGVRIVRTASYEPAALIRRMRGSRGTAETGGGAYVEDLKLGTVGSAVRSFARKWLYFPDSAIGWTYPALRTAKALHREAPFDCVLSSSPPVSAHLAAEKFSRASGVPWIADWRDLWVSDLRSGMTASGRARRLEKRLLDSCAGITGATEGVTRMQARGREDRIPSLTVRNGYEPADLAGALPEPPSAGRFTIVYAGTVYERSVQEMLGLFEAVKAIAAARGRGSIRVAVLGKCDPSNRSLPDGLGIGDLVDFEGFLPHDRVMRRLRGAGMVLLMGSRLPNEAGRAGVPAKTLECLASGRPVLLLAPGDTEVAGFLRGVPGVASREFGDVPGIGADIAAAMDGTGTAGVVPAGFLRDHTRAAQAGRLALFMDSVVSRRTGTRAGSPGGGVADGEGTR